MKDRIFFEKCQNKNVFCIENIPPHSKNIVIFSHGFRGDSCGPARQFVDFSRIINKNKIATLRFDQPNSGNSEGEFLDSSFSEWVQTTAYFAKKYLDAGYRVALLGQSMGASTSVVASSQTSIAGKIAALLLWVPDPKTTINLENSSLEEEGGQQYRGSFWNEAQESDFFGSLSQYAGPIHLVYGQEDRYISEELRERVMKAVEEKKGKIMVMEGEDHSPWQFANAQRVMNEELQTLLNAFSQ